MKNSLEDSKIYRLFKKRFLSPTESNRDELTRLINKTFKIFPVPIKSVSPYLGGSGGNYTFLKTHEKIPNSLADRKKVLKDAFRLLTGAIRWHSPDTLQNVTPPPLIESVAISTLVNLYNPNLIWDHVSAGAQEAEQQIVRQISKLIGWTGNTDGVFTYGGKGCLTYAIRIGMNRCIPRMSSEGMRGARPVVLTTEYNHYIIESVCSLLGLGSNSCIRVKTLKDETMDLADFERVISKVFSEKRPIACIILSGGSTLTLSIDPIDSAIRIINRKCLEYKIKYRPFIYFDTVVGWPWLFYKNYDFIKNPLKISGNALQKIKIATRRLSKVCLADGAGIDFHKIGFASYNNSAFFVKNSAELHSIFKDKPDIRRRGSFGKNFLQQHTIEHSRSAAPVLAAWVILQSVGVIGFQMYLAQMITVADIFRSILPKYGFEVLNLGSLSFAAVYYPIPPKGPSDFESLKKTTPENINYANKYIYELSRYLAREDKGRKDPVDLGFFKLMRADCGLDLNVLRIYPMSPYLDTKRATYLANIIGKKKQSFDKTNRSKKGDLPIVLLK